VSKESSPHHVVGAFATRSLSRRSFLALGATVAASPALAACTGGDRSPAWTRIGPTSGRVADAERARRAAGAVKTSVNLNAVVEEVDLGGISVRTWTYGGGELPGPEIRVNHGDVLKARVSNRLPQPTTVHWHGIALRNDMDGVPDLTQPPIATDESFDYDFVVPDPGTHWFHPHVGTQLDRGLYGVLIVDDPDEQVDYDDEVVIVLDDWLDGIDTDPDTVFRDLKASGMDHGDHGDMDMGADGMGAMPTSGLLGGDAGDVSYPYVLANGRISDAPRTVRTRPGRRLRLRLVNAASDTAFRVGVPGITLQVTHTDGFPVVARRADTVLIGMGERLDAVITMPEDSVPVVALAEGRDSYAQVVLSTATTPAAQVDDTVIRQMKSRPVLTVSELTATGEVALAQKSPDVTHDLVLGGPGDGYEWTINDTLFDHDNPFEASLPVRPGQRVRLRFRNDTQMYHPMHLHGHTFQVRGPGGHGARKDTVLVLPNQTVEVEFDADNVGQWLTHCHNVYHGEAGMMAVMSYVE
jgi:FtsP/CotA-like multicopper oxidase with cupredoxin domain